MMLCYQDRTFCKHYETCKHADDCNRPLTPEVQKKADAWWAKGGGSGSAPVSVFIDKPVCHSDLETTND